MLPQPPIRELFQSLHLPITPMTSLRDERTDFVASLPVEGSAGGWLEIHVPEALAHKASAVMLGKDLAAIDDLSAFDGLRDLLLRLREMLLARLPVSSRIGTPQVALRVGLRSAPAGITDAFSVDGHPVLVQFQRP